MPHPDHHPLLCVLPLASPSVHSPCALPQLDSMSYLILPALIEGGLLGAAAKVRERPASADEERESSVCERESERATRERRLRRPSSENAAQNEIEENQRLHVQ